MRRLFLLGIGVFLCATLLSCTRGNESGLNPGDTPPAIELPDLDGAIKKFSDFHGKVILLNFWATWCGPCVAELPALEQLYSRLKEKGFTVVAIGVDDEASALSVFKQRYGISFPILVDKSGATKSRFRVSGVPESFVLDREGKLLMIQDPDENMPVVRIIGPRDWDAPNMVSQIEALLSEAK